MMKLRWISDLFYIEQDDADTRATGSSFNNRPRSFSDYTSTLGSRASDRSLWHEAIGANALTATLDNQQHYLDARAPTALPKDTVLELWKALKTSFATRHVLVKSGALHFDPDDVQHLSDMMHVRDKVSWHDATLERELTR